MDLAVACADVGAVSSGKFGWPLWDGSDSPEDPPERDSIAEFADAIVEQLEPTLDTPPAGGTDLLLRENKRQ